jgi:hypothetical protein
MYFIFSLHKTTISVHCTMVLVHPFNGCSVPYCMFRPAVGHEGMMCLLTGQVMDRLRAVVNTVMNFLRVS